jgi:small subunit ribosomal protein S16
MLSIRLSRIGKKNKPSYRLIVTEKSRDPVGKYLEILGFYNPRLSSEISNLKEERLNHWLKIGAEPSPTVHNLLINQGIIKGNKIRLVKLKKKEMEEKRAEAPKEQPAKEEPAKEQPAKEESEPQATA